MTVWSCICWAQAHFPGEILPVYPHVENGLPSLRISIFRICWTDTWPDLLYLKWKCREVPCLINLVDNNYHDILCVGQYLKTWLFSYYSSNLGCMLQGVSKLNYVLVFRLPLACSQYLCFSVFDVSAAQSTVCTKIVVKTFCHLCVLHWGRCVWTK